MTYLLRLKNQVLNSLADECGVIIASDNREATASELEFFAEEIVKKCIDLCLTHYHTGDGFGVTNGDIRCARAIAQEFEIDVPRLRSYT